MNFEDKKKPEDAAHKYPLPSRHCGLHNRWTDDYGDCLECLSGPTLGSEEWDEIEVRIKERRRK